MAGHAFKMQVFGDKIGPELRCNVLNVTVIHPKSEIPYKFSFWFYGDEVNDSEFIDLIASEMSEGFKDLSKYISSTYSNGRES